MRHRARLVPEFQVEIQIPLAIGPKLLVSDEKRIVDRIAIGELTYVAASHAGIRFVQARLARRGPGTASGVGDRFYERSGAWGQVTLVLRIRSRDPFVRKNPVRSRGGAMLAPPRPSPR